MPLDDNNNIYNGEPLGTPEQEATKRARQRALQASLPKFKLEDGQEFYIPREKVIELNGAYFQMLDDMQAGFNIAPQDLRSYMESVVFFSYVGEITQLQRAGEIEGARKAMIHMLKKMQLTPANERPHIFARKRPNAAMRLCLREAGIETEVKKSEYRETINRQEEFLLDETERAEQLLYELMEGIVPRRKRKRFVRKNGEYLMGLLSEYIRKPDIPPAPEPAPTVVDVHEPDELEAEEEDLNVLYELEDEEEPGDESADLCDDVAEPEDELDELDELEDEEFEDDDKGDNP